MALEVGDKVEEQARSTENAGRIGRIAEVVRDDPSPRYRILWDGTTGMRACTHLPPAACTRCPKHRGARRSGRNVGANRNHIRSPRGRPRSSCDQNPWQLRMRSAGPCRTMALDGRSSTGILSKSRGLTRRPFAVPRAGVSCAGGVAVVPPPELVRTPHEHRERCQGGEVQRAERGGAEQRLQWR